MKNIKKILIVEDNEINQDLLAAILSKAGYEIHQAWNGMEAIEKADNTSFDVIFMDIQMPGIDGFETSRQIREREYNKEAVIVALTAYSIDTKGKLFTDAGMNHYLPKPLKIKEVVNLLEELKTAIQSGVVREPEYNSNLIVDIDRILDEMNGNRVLMEKTIKVMIESYPEKINRIEKHIKEEEYFEVAKAAHSFKGSIGMLSNNICIIAKELENESKNEKKEKVRQIFEKLKEEMKRIEEFIVGYFSNK